MSYTALLKIDGIKGDANIPSHEGEIEVDAVRHAVRSPAQKTDGAPDPGSGDRKDHELVIASSVGPGTPKLFEAVVTGKHLPKAVVTFLSMSPTGKVSEFMIITMTDVVVSSIHPISPGRTFSAIEPTPKQEVTFNYGKIEWEYKPIEDAKSTGPVKTAWDLKSAK